jgi:hypothetical protein
MATGDPVWSLPGDLPAPPGFVGRPPDLVHRETHLLAWLTEPAGVITQVPRPMRAPLSSAAFFVEHVSSAVLALPHRGPEGVVWMHDWSNVEGYPSEMRAAMTRWGHDVRQQTQAVVIVMPKTSSALARMGIEVGAAALRVAGIRMHVVNTIAEAQQRVPLRPRSDGRGPRLV